MSIASDIAKRRKLEITDFDIDENFDGSIDDYFNSVLNTDTTKSSEEYRKLLDETDYKFKKESALTDKDLAFLGLATALQLTRIYVINKITEVQKAGKGSREHKLHETQDKILDKYKVDEEQLGRKYYAPINQIVGSHGVPYDSTHYQNSNHGLFKGGNHRFATIGHDAILGLVIGTGNILTNTITCNNSEKSGLLLPNIRTYHVNYTSNFSARNTYSSPKIDEQASTVIMLKEMSQRVVSEPEAFAAALIKQIIHIGTDMFTPMGLHLPGLNILTSTKTTQEITKYISIGDIAKIGGSAVTSMAINTIISILHRLMYIGEDGIDTKVCEVRTRKIIMYSNIIATGSNLCEVAFTKNLANLDIGGALVTAYRIATDTKFMHAVRHEYLNEKTSAVYKEKAKEFDMLYS